MATKGRTESGLMDDSWVKIQQKTFTKWCNGHLIRRFGHQEPVMDIEKVNFAFENGITLMKLVNALYNIPMPARYAKAPKMKPQMLDNIALALKMLEQDAGVKTNFLKGTHLVDHDMKMILGMIWSIILDYQIKGISVEEMSAREGLLRWCQRKTQGYRDVKVDNFTTSWVDGLAFCALIHAHRPGLIDFDSLNKENKKENLKLAFDIAEKQLGINPLLDPEDLVDVARPDEKSVITYVSEWFHYFASQNQFEVASRRIAKVLKTTQQNDLLRQEYGTKSSALVAWIKATIAKMNDRNFDNTLSGAQKNMETFNDYKKNEKPPKLAEKIDAEQVFNNLAMKLRANQRPPFQPEHSPAELNSLWQELEASEQARDAALRAELQRQLKLQSLVALFNHKHKLLVEWANAKQHLLDSLKGEVFTSVNQVQVRLRLVAALDEEYDASIARVGELKQLGKEIIAENYEHKDQIQAKMDGIDATWAKLKEESTARTAILNEEAKRQEEIDAARKLFARLVSALDRYLKDMIEEAKDHNFGNTLEAVTGYLATMEAQQSEIEAEYNTKKTELDAAAEALTALNVTTNQYTLLTLGHIDQRHQSMLEEFEKRKTAYDAELARQQMMEEKRIAFAKAAGELVAYVDGLKKQVMGATGEPEAQIEFVEGLIKSSDGKSRLDTLDAMDAEMKQLGIADNKHTDLTIAILHTRWNMLNAFVANYLASLRDDAEMKSKIAAHVAEWEHKNEVENYKIAFAKKSGELNQWLVNAIGILTLPIFAKTTGDAQKVLDEATSIEVELQGKSSARDELAALNDQLIAEGVTENPLAELSLTQVDAKIAECGEAVTSRRAEAAAELKKQETHEQLRKNFAEHAGSLNSFLDAQLSGIGGTTGEPDDQLDQLNKISHLIHGKKGDWDVVVADDKCLIDNGITENEHTKITIQDLDAKWKLCEKSMSDKRQLLQSTLEQLKGSQVSEEQLREMKECFGHFDKDSDGVLTLLDFKACLSSLGEDLTEEEARKQCPDGSMNFEQFSAYMRGRLADTATKEEVSKSFKVLAADKPFITDAELKNNFDAATYAYLVAHMPKCDGGYDYSKYNEDIFSR